MNSLQLDGIFSDGYGIIAKKIMKDKALNTTSKAIYAYLCSYSGKGKTAFPSQSLICCDLDLSKSTLAKYMKELKEHGYIEVEQIKEKGKFARNAYTLKTIPCSKIQYTETSVSAKTVNGKSNTNNNSLNNNNSFNNTIIKDKTKFEKSIELISTLESERQLILKEWLEYKKSRNQSYTEVGLKKLISTIEEFSDLELKTALDSSISNNYAGLFPKHTNKPKSNFYRADANTPKEVVNQFEVIDFGDD